MTVRQHKHKCAIPHCQHSIPLRYAMCQVHWAMVPMELKSRLWEYYSFGQELNLSSIRPEYITALNAAVEAVLRSSKA